MESIASHEATGNIMFAMISFTKRTEFVWKKMFNRPVWESGYGFRKSENGRSCSELGKRSIFLVEPEGKKRGRGGHDRVNSI